MIRYDGCHSPLPHFYGAIFFFSFLPFFFNVHFSPFARRPASDCLTKRLGNAIFTRSQCVSPVIGARAVTRRHSARKGCHSSKAIYFVGGWCVASGPHFLSGVSSARSVGQVPYALPLIPPLDNTRRARVLCNFHYKRKRSEMDRLATRIYCGVAAFEREHALGCEEKECGIPVGLYKQRKRRAQSDMLATSHIRRVSSDGRHIELLLCTGFVYREIDKFSLRPGASMQASTK